MFAAPVLRPLAHPRVQAKAGAHLGTVNLSPWPKDQPPHRRNTPDCRNIPILVQKTDPGTHRGTFWGG
jgi:hypothetical protein